MTTPPSFTEMMKTAHLIDLLYRLGVVGRRDMGKVGNWALTSATGAAAKELEDNEERIMKIAAHWPFDE